MKIEKLFYFHYIPKSKFYYYYYYYRIIKNYRYYYEIIKIILLLNRKILKESQKRFFNTLEYEYCHRKGT